MNPTTAFNKLEILLYSTFISVMSGINKLKTRAQPISHTSSQNESPFVVEAMPLPSQEPEASASLPWESFQQTVLSLVLWIILGLAAGFLIGMIKNG
jgi:hypothetical protein